MRGLKETQAVSWRKMLTRFTAAALSSVVLVGTAFVSVNPVWADEVVEDTQEVTDETVEAKAQKIKLMTSGKSYTGDKLAAKKQTFKIGASAKTALSYKVTKGSKYVSVNEKGTVAIQKGTPTGKYEVTVTAAATAEYKKAVAVVKISVVPHLKNVNISWDLKQNKTVKYRNIYGPGIAKNDKLTITDYKITNAKKAGYKQLKFTILFDRALNFSKKEQEKIMFYADGFEGWAALGGDEYYTLVDYETGECLERKNPHHVSVKSSKWKNSGKKKFTLDNGYWFSFYKKASCTVTVTYPKSYKNLCIIAGGQAEQVYEAYNTDFWDGTNGVKYFAQATSLYSKKYKSVAHAMRVK